MQSVKGTTKIITFRKLQTHRHHSQHHIPSRQQASERQSGLKTFHMRKTHLKRKSLEGICRQNYRLYFCINRQKSSYQELFADKHIKKSRTKDSARYSNVLNDLPHQQQMQCFKSELKKVTRLKQLLSGKQNLIESKKRQYMRCFKTSKSVTTHMTQLVKENLQNSKRN